MLKNIGKALLGFALVLSFGLVALPAHASSLTPGQVSAIVSLLQSFGVDQSVVNQVTEELGGTPSVSLAACVNTYSATRLGSSGPEVTALQNYLIKVGLLPSDDNTGYYGPITARAVGALQLNDNILSSMSDADFGVMTPKTRATIACQDGSYGNVMSAGIDQTNVNDPTNSFTLTGTASGANSIFVALVPSAYSGSMAWSDLYANHAYVAFTGDQVTHVAYGKWSAAFSGIPSGTYTALVYDADGTDQGLLDQGTLTVIAPTPVNFVVGTGVTGTVGVGQTATDGGITIVPTLVGYSNGTTGTLTGTFIITVNGYQPGTYSGTIGSVLSAPGSLGDSNALNGDVSITISGLSATMRTATLKIVPGPAKG